MTEANVILHIALPDHWAAARRSGEYRMSTRDRTVADEGFVHCSYPNQVVGIANRFYRDVIALVILHIEHELVHAAMKLEPAFDRSGELFPHLYGPLPTDAVIATTWWRRGDDGRWHRPPTI